MKLDDMVVAWVTSLLKKERVQWPEVLARLETMLGESWSVRRLAQPNTYSLGARLRDGRELPLAGWLEGLGTDGEPLEVRALDLGSRAPEKLPEHIAAAFASTQALVLALRSRGISSVYVLETVVSHRSLISPAQLVELALLQPHADRVLEAWARVITESNELNGRPAVEVSQVARYLCSREGAGVLDFLGGDLMSELQSTVRREGVVENIPEAYRSFFHTSDPDDFDRQMLGPDRQHEFIPSEERLYLESEATAQDFVALVEAQPFAREIWERIARNLNQFLAEGETPYTAESIAAKLRDGGPEAHRELPMGNLTQEWQGCCRGHGVEPIIPEALRGCLRLLGPTPEERKRDKGLLLEREKLRLKPNTEGYQMYLFRELEDAPPLLDSPARPTTEVREEFLGALREAESFAEQQDSPFFEAFKLARFVLESDALRLTGKLSPERVDALQEALKAAGFSERAGEVFGRKVNAVSDFEPFHPSEEKLRGLLACTVADVFGGMGSWNDQYFDTPEAHERYEQVSSRLFGTLRAFNMAILNAE
ncbi:hypothetical protein ACN28E_26225 [Archangium lansingense]|uniref:hypothetical protein n=1 Tax=Archangium lansingense TaxID=2995310 RepID=UPI003B7A12CD